MNALALDGFMVAVHHGPDLFTLTPVRTIAGVETGIRGHWEGPLPAGTRAPERLIWFSIGWHAAHAGSGYDDIGRMAAEIAAHLAAADGDGWGSEAVHVYGLPVVDPRFAFWAFPELPPAAEG